MSEQQQTEQRRRAPEAADLPRGILKILQDKNNYETPDARHKAVAELVCNTLKGRGQFYFNKDRPERGFCMFFDRPRHLLQRVKSDAFTAWVSNVSGVNRTQRVWQFIMARIEDEALVGDSVGITPSEYWHATDSAIYLSSGDGHLVRIRPNAVEICDNGTDGVLFASGRTLPEWELTTPENPFETCRIFRDMPTECEAAKTVFMLWLLSLPADQRTKPILCVVGTVGSGKTRAVVGACQFYGMTPRINALTEKGEDEFWNSANTGGIYGLDNADTKTKWLVDALAAASTGGTREKRKLYTDSDVIIQRARAAVAVTSSNPSFGSDSGLADRLLVVRLHRIDMQTAESAITDEILAARDAGLSWVAHTLSKALADTAPTPDGLNRRHPDFADLAVRIARALDIETEAIDALRWAEKDKSLFNLEHSDVGQGLLAVIKPETPFSGTAAALLELLRESDEYFNGNYWNAKRMGRKLSAIWPHIKTVFNRAVMHDARGGKLYEIYA